MAIVKVLGMETEYGIIIRGGGGSEPHRGLFDARSTPMWPSSTAGSSGTSRTRRPVATPGASPGRAPCRPRSRPIWSTPFSPTGPATTWTTPTRSTRRPECANVYDVILYDKAGELILAESIAAASRALPAGQSLVVLKNNSDGKGNSYGTHENYLMDRSIPFTRIVANVMPHFVSRQIFTGAGKVGCEASSTGGLEVDFQLTQRADFFEEEVGLETTLKRPIVNTRDEPHCDAHKYRRLHVIVGDANMSEVANFLKVGTTALVLAMIEDDWFARANRDFSLQSPVGCLRKVSYDLNLDRPLDLADGHTMTALEMQWEHLDLARKYAEDCGLDAVGGAEIGGDILRRWEQTLAGSRI